MGTYIYIYIHAHVHVVYVYIWACILYIRTIHTYVYVYVYTHTCSCFQKDAGKRLVSRSARPLTEERRCSMAELWHADPVDAAWGPSSRRHTVDDPKWLSRTRNSVL